MALEGERALRLDAPREEVLARAAELIAGAWRSFDHFRPEEPPLDERVRSLLLTSLPEDPHPALEVLDDAARILDESVTQPRPRYFAYIGSSGLEIGAIADALASTYDANLGVWAGAATEIERQAVRWVGEFVRYPAGAGAFTSGGTVSNVTALAAARERALPKSRELGLSDARPAVYCSIEAHYSVKRAVELLGIGSRNVRALPVDGCRRLDAESVAEAIDRDRAEGVTPVAVVATAGTTLTGAIDPIADLVEICAEREVWLHVDGAYGLPAVGVPTMMNRFEGLDRADSVSLDAHKWLFLPKACGVLLVRLREHLEAAFGHEAAYLRREQEEPLAVDITLEYSRPFRALKVWLAFRAHGAGAFREAIERNLRQARLLYEQVLRHDDLEALGPPELSIVPFRHIPEGVADVDEHNARLARELQRDGQVYLAPASIGGDVYLRPCVVNFRTTDDDVLALVALSRELGNRIAVTGS